jgi:DNA-binding transcriptional ArsR family regulator
MSKPAVSQHLAVLENVGLVESEKRGQFVFYRLVPDNLVNTLNGYVQEVCPSRARSRQRVRRLLARGRKPIDRVFGRSRRTSRHRSVWTS